jgi:hypothetical protein
MGKAYTYTSRSFSGKIIVEKTTGKKKLKLLAPMYYEHELNKFAENDPVSVVLTNRRAKRTARQNNYWWGVYLPLIIGEGKGAGSSLETHEDLDREGMEK